jgi:hypothetical protein
VIELKWTDKLRMETLIGSGKSDKVSDEMVEMEMEDLGYEVYS